MPAQALLLISLLLAAAPPDTPQPEPPSFPAVETKLPDDPRRGMVGDVFVSEAVPPLRMRVDKRFRYVGRERYLLKGVAHVDRHHWVAEHDGRVEAMLVLQFEGFLDGVDDHYRYGLPTEDDVAGSNYRFSPQFIELGGAEYIQNTWAYDDAQLRRESPGAESDRTTRFLAEQGLQMADARIMSRFVRVVGDDRRHELIIFYIEPLAAHGHTIDEFPDGGPPGPVFDRLSERITARSLASFVMLDR